MRPCPLIFPLAALQFSRQSLLAIPERPRVVAEKLKSCGLVQAGTTGPELSVQKGEQPRAQERGLTVSRSAPVRAL